MHAILDYWDKLWAWLLTNATAVIVPISAFYAFLTWRMTKAVARQTRAMIQPVALLEFHWKEKKYHPVSYFEIKNLGTQPLLLLDVTLWCGCGMPQRKSFTKHYTLWDEHIIPPGESLCPQFDFKGELEQDKLPWSPDALSYSLEVVASDLSRQVVLTYRNIPVLSIVNVDKGMPLSVRWRYFLKPFVRRYYRLLYRFKPPKIRN
jgi:hypothetical protein